MATYHVNAPNTHISERVASEQWDLGTNTGSNLGIVSVTDGETNQVWDVGEAVTVTFFRIGGGTIDFGGFYRGTVTIDGVVYPVVQLNAASGGTHYALGSGNVSETLGNISSLLNTSGSFTVCFFPGTMIATPSGERRIEDLVPGDPVLIGAPGVVPVTWTERLARKLLQRFGFGRAVPVKWVGRQTVSTLFGPAERLMPVRFAAGSLGGGGGASPFCRIAT